MADLRTRVSASLTPEAQARMDNAGANFNTDQAFQSSISSELSKGWISAGLSEKGNALLDQANNAYRAGDEATGRAIEAEGVRTLEQARIWAPSVQRASDIQDLGGAVKWGMGALASGVRSTLPSSAGAVVGGAIGGLATRSIRGAQIGAGIGAGSAGYNQMANETIGEAMMDPSIRATKGYQEIKDTGRVSGALQAPLEAIVPGVMGGAVLGLTKGLGKAGIGRAVAAGMGTGAVTEAGTEFAQDLVGQGAMNSLRDKPLTQDLDYRRALDSAAAGAVAGGGMSAAGGAMTGLHARGAGLVDQGKDAAANPGQLLDKGAVLAGDALGKAHNAIDKAKSKLSGSLDEFIASRVVDPDRHALLAPMTEEEANLSGQELVDRFTPKAQAWASKVLQNPSAYDKEDVADATEFGTTNDPFLLQSKLKSRMGAKAGSKADEAIANELSLKTKSSKLRSNSSVFGLYRKGDPLDGEDLIGGVSSQAQPPINRVSDSGFSHSSVGEYSGELMYSANEKPARTVNTPPVEQRFEMDDRHGLTRKLLSEEARASAEGTKKEWDESTRLLAKIWRKQGIDEGIIQAVEGSEDDPIKQNAAIAVMSWVQRGFKDADGEVIVPEQMIRAYGAKRAGKLIKNAYDLAVGQGLVDPNESEATFKDVQDRVKEMGKGHEADTAMVIENLTPIARNKIVDALSFRDKASAQEHVFDLAKDIRSIVQAKAVGDHFGFLHELFGPKMNDVLDHFQPADAAVSSTRDVVADEKASFEADAAQETGEDLEYDPAINEVEADIDSKTRYVSQSKTNEYFDMHDELHRGRFDEETAKQTDPDTRVSKIGLVDREIEKVEAEQGRTLPPAERFEVTKRIVEARLARPRPKEVPNLPDNATPEQKKAHEAAMEDYRAKWDEYSKLSIHKPSKLPDGAGPEQTKAHKKTVEDYERRVRAAASKLNMQYKAMRVSTEKLAEPRVNFSEGDVDELHLKNLDHRGERATIQRGVLFFDRGGNKTPYATSTAMILRRMFRIKDGTQKGTTDNFGGDAANRLELLKQGIASLMTSGGFGRVGYIKYVGQKPTWIKVKGGRLPSDLTIDVNEDDGRPITVREAEAQMAKHLAKKPGSSNGTGLEGSVVTPRGASPETKKALDKLEVTEREGTRWRTVRAQSTKEIAFKLGELLKEKGATMTKDVRADIVNATRRFWALNKKGVVAHGYTAEKIEGEIDALGLEHGFDLTTVNAKFDPFTNEPEDIVPSERQLENYESDTSRREDDPATLGPRGKAIKRDERGFINSGNATMVAANMAGNESTVKVKPTQKQPVKEPEKKTVVQQDFSVQNVIDNLIRSVASVVVFARKSAESGRGVGALLDVLRNIEKMTPGQIRAFDGSLTAQGASKIKVRATNALARIERVGDELHRSGPGGDVETGAQGEVVSVHDEDLRSTDVVARTDVGAAAVSRSRAVAEGVRGEVNVWHSTGEHANLSNLAPRPFEVKGVKYHSVEHAYQSWKSGAFDQETYDKYATGGRKIAGTKGTKTEGGWNLALMERIMRASFEQNPTAVSDLLATGDAKITHKQDRGVWATEFPRMLTKLREEFAKGEVEGVAGGAAAGDTRAGLKPKTSMVMRFKDGTDFAGIKHVMRDGFRGKSTMDLIMSGDRTATTRNTKPDLQVGDIVTMDDGRGTKADVRITKAPYQIKLFGDERDQRNAEKWSRLEGWAPEVFKAYASKGAWQIQYDLVEKPASGAAGLKSWLSKAKTADIEKVKASIAKMNPEQLAILEKAVRDYTLLDEIGFDTDSKGAARLSAIEGAVFEAQDAQGEGVTVVEHPSSGYRDRTKHNADSAGATVAIATDFDTAGEKLTKRLAGDKIVQIPIAKTPASAAKALIAHMQALGVTTLNVAGNGIYTLNEKLGVTQAQVNQYVYDTLKAAHLVVGITKIVTGGQTGVDIAGAIAAKRLGIPVDVTMPKGFLQRDMHGKDFTQTKEKVVAQIEDGARSLVDKGPVVKSSKVSTLADKRAEKLKAKAQGIMDSMSDEDLAVLQNDITNYDWDKGLKIPSVLKVSFDDWMSNYRGSEREEMMAHENRDATIERFLEDVAGDPINYEPAEVAMALHILAGGGIASASKTKAEGKTLTEASPEVQAAKEHILKTVGNKIGLKFVKAFRDGKSGEHQLNLSGQENVIRIALNGDVLGTAYHESIHEFFDILSAGAATATRDVLLRAGKNKRLLREVSRLLDGHPEAQAQLSDPEEAVAYIYQFWKAGALKIGPETKTLFEKISEYFRNVLGLVSDEMRERQDLLNAEKILTAFDQGTYGEETIRAGVMAAINADVERQDAALKAVGEKWTTVVNTAGKLVLPAEQVIEASDNKHLLKVLRAFHQKTGDGMGEKASFFEAVSASKNRFMTRIEGVLAKRDKKDLELARKHLINGTTPTDPVTLSIVLKTREVLEDLYKFAAEKQVARWDEKTHEWVGLQHRKDYFPQVWDIDALLKNGDVFKAKLIETHQKELQAILDKTGDAGVTIDDVAQAILSRMLNSQGQVELDETTSDLGISPMAAAVNRRALDWLDNDVFDQFKEKDVVKILSSYVSSMVKRAEYTDRFGRGGEVLRTAADEAVLEEIGGSKLVNEATAKLPAAIAEWRDNLESGIKAPRPTLRGVGEVIFATKKGKDVLTEAREKALKKLGPSLKAVMALEGTLGSDIKQGMRTFNSWMMTYQNFRLLSTSLFASFSDTVGLVLNGGELGDAWDGFVRGIREIKLRWQDNKSRDMAAVRAEQWGTVDAGSTLDALGQTYGSAWMSGTARRWSDSLFKWNGMEAWNRAMRITATNVAERIIREFKEKGFDKNDKAAVARFEELFGRGFKPENIKLDANGELDISDSKNQAAVNRWVNGAILRPNAAQRTVWGSDPHFQMIWHMKQFTYTFQNVILGKVIEQAKLGNYRPAMVMMAGYTPIIIAADAVKEMLIPGDEPPWMKGGLAGLIQHGVDKAGLLGIGQMGYDAMASDYGAGLTGPAISQLLHVPFDDPAKTTLGALPLGNLARRAAYD